MLHAAFRIFACILFAASLAFAAEERACEPVVSLALSNNPSIRAALKEYEAAVQAVLPSYFPANPWVTYEYMSKDGSQSIAVNQMIDFPLKTVYKAGVKIHDAAMARERYAEIRTRVRRDTALTFYTIAFKDGLIRIEEDRKKELTLFRDVAESKYRVGRGEQADFVKAKINILLTEKKVRTLTAEREAAYAALLALTGTNKLPESVVFSCAGAVPEIPANAVFAVTNRFPGVLEKKAALDKADAAAMSMTFDWLPDISLMGSYTFAPMKGDVTLSAGLTVPLYAPFKDVPNALSAGAMRDAASHELAAARAETAAAVAALYAEYRAKRDVLGLFKGSIIHEARQSVDASFKSYETDKLSFFMLLENIFMLYDYTIEQETARYEAHTALANLMYYGVMP